MAVAEDPATAPYCTDALPGSGGTQVAVEWGKIWIACFTMRRSQKSVWGVVAVLLYLEHFALASVLSIRRLLCIAATRTPSIESQVRATTALCH